METVPTVLFPVRVTVRSELVPGVLSKTASAPAELGWLGSKLALVQFPFPSTSHVLCARPVATRRKSIPTREILLKIGLNLDRKQFMCE